MGTVTGVVWGRRPARELARRLSFDPSRPEGFAEVTVT